MRAGTDDEPSTTTNRGSFRSSTMSPEERAEFVRAAIAAKAAEPSPAGVGG